VCEKKSASERIERKRRREEERRERRERKREEEREREREREEGRWCGVMGEWANGRGGAEPRRGKNKESESEIATLVLQGSLFC
jgi:hypothetical protein